MWIIWSTNQQLCPLFPCTWARRACKSERVMEAISDSLHYSQVFHQKRFIIAFTCALIIHSPLPLTQIRAYYFVWNNDVSWECPAHLLHHSLGLRAVWWMTIQHGSKIVSTFPSVQRKKLKKQLDTSSLSLGPVSLECPCPTRACDLQKGVCSS